MLYRMNIVPIQNYWDTGGTSLVSDENIGCKLKPFISYQSTISQEKLKQVHKWLNFDQKYCCQNSYESWMMVKNFSLHWRWYLSNSSPCNSIFYNVCVIQIIFLCMVHSNLVQATSVKLHGSCDACQFVDSNNLCAPTRKTKVYTSKTVQNSKNLCNKSWVHNHDELCL